MGTERTGMSTLRRSEPISVTENGRDDSIFPSRVIWYSCDDLLRIRAGQGLLKQCQQTPCRCQRSSESWFFQAWQGYQSLIWEREGAPSTQPKIAKLQGYQILLYQPRWIYIRATRRPVTLSHFERSSWGRNLVVPESNHFPICTQFLWENFDFHKVKVVTIAYPPYEIRVRSSKCK